VKPSGKNHPLQPIDLPGAWLLLAETRDEIAVMS